MPSLPHTSSERGACLNTANPLLPLPALYVLQTVTSHTLTEAVLMRGFAVDPTRSGFNGSKATWETGGARGV